MVNELDRLVKGVISGNRRTVAKCMSLVENGRPLDQALLRRLYSHIGNAYRIGVTGPPGAGKSTIAACLIKRFREAGQTVGVVAVDPTSPFSGGAILGDRIRMLDFSNDPEVFIRSLASRGNLGGLGKKAQEVADILDAAGKDIIIFETVGVGQTELEIADAADTTVVTLVPESGDSIQTMKAGLMEIADIFVVNKADREGADQLAKELRMSLHLRATSDEQWQPPIAKTIALDGTGVDRLRQAILDHQKYLGEANRLQEKRKASLLKRVREMLLSELGRKYWTKDIEQAALQELTAVLEHQRSLYDLVNDLLPE